MGNEDFPIYSISAEKLHVPFEKWEQLMILLQDSGYINGLVVSRALEDKYRHIAEPINPAITLKGIEYLENNSVMAKAGQMLKDAGDIIGVIKP